MAKARWTRESAIQYLVSNPDFTPTKDYDDYSTSYLKRQASQLQDAEIAGRKAPTITERRGHARATVIHNQHPQNGLPYWRIEKPKDRDLDAKDLQNLFKRGYKPKGLNYLVTFAGIVSKGSPVLGKGTGTDSMGRDARSYWLNKHSVRMWMQKNPNGTPLDMAIAFTPSTVVWDEVDAVSIVEVESVKKTA